MNSVALVGRLTRDPEIRYIKDGEMAVARFSLAVNRPFSKKDEADFINIVVFGKSAENCGKYLFKGSMAGVNGRIQTGSYEKDGKKVYTTDVVADRVEFLAKPKSTNGASAGEDNGIPEGFYEMDDDDEENIPF